MSYEPIQRVNNTNRLNRTKSSNNIRRPIYDLFEDTIIQHHLDINENKMELFLTLLMSFKNPTFNKTNYEIDKNDSALINLLKHICNGQPIHLLNTNIYLEALKDLLYMYNRCKDCVTCVKYHALPNMKKRGILPIFKQVIDYLIEHRPNIVDDNRKIFSVLLQKYYTYIINDNVEFLSNFNVTTIEDIELYRKLYAVEKKAFKSLIVN